MKPEIKFTPQISVVMLSYNFESFIGEAIESILSQTLPVFELIIADDCSTDHSWEIISGFARKHPQIIRAFRREKNLGHILNGKLAIDQVRGNLFTPMDGDDRFRTGKFELEWQALQKNPQAKIAYSNVIGIDEQGRETGRWYKGPGTPPPSGDVFIQTFAKKFFPGSGSVFRNPLMYAAIIRETPYETADETAFHADWDWKLRLAARYPVIYSGEALVEYRHHGGGISKQNRPGLFYSSRAVFEKNKHLLQNRPETEKELVLSGIKETLKRQAALAGVFFDEAQLRLTDEKPAPVLINSLPKAGTHLLLKIFEQFPGWQSSAVHIGRSTLDTVSGLADSDEMIPVGVDMPKPAPVQWLRSELQKIEPGQFASAHMPWSAGFERLISEQKMKMILIVRDPRDVVLSHARFLAETESHPFYSLYKNLSEEDRLLTSIRGAQWNGNNLAGIAGRCESVLAWQKCSYVLTVRFEDLVGPQGGGSREAQLSALQQIADHVGIYISPLQLTRIADHSFGGTHTFRKGAIGAWKSKFSQGQKALFEQSTGELLSKMGYQKSNEQTGATDRADSGSKAGADMSSQYLGENLIFLISQPRAGSTLLQRMLGSHPEIHTLSEPWLMLPPLFGLKTDGVQAGYEWQLGRNALDDLLKNVPEGEELYFEGVRAMAGVLYNRLINLSGKSLFLDKTPRYYLILPELKRAFPKAKFIFIWRNPLSVLSSMLENWYGNNPQNLRSGYNFMDLSEAPGKILDGLGLLKEQAFTLHYEELVTRPEAELEKLCQFLNLSFDPQMIEYGRGGQLKGRYGDQGNINQKVRPEATSLEKWQSHLLSNPAMRQFAVEYLTRLGSALLGEMGYKYDQLLSALEAKTIPALKPALSLTGQIDEISWLREENQSGEAFRRLLELEKTNPHHPELLNLKGEMLLEDGQTEAAEQIFRGLIAGGLALVSGYNNLAVIQAMRGEFSAARASLQRVLELDARNENALANLDYVNSQSTAAPAATLKFSVVTASFNQGQYIAQTIQSVLGQQYPDFEHIVIDGQSTDQTLNILKTQPHLRWVSEKDSGQTNALNKGLRMAGGDIIAIINSDDYYLPGAFEAVARVFREHPESRVVIGDCRFIYSNSARTLRVNNRDLTFEDIIRYWHVWIPPTQPAIFFRREVLDEFGLWDENLHYAMDYEFWLRISRKYQFRHLPAEVAAYRFHESSKSGTGNQWSVFYPEWHQVYLKYKPDSRLLPQTTLVTVALPLPKVKSNDKEFQTRFRETVAYFSGQRLGDIEILIVSDQANAANALPKELRSDMIRFAAVKLLNSAEFYRTVQEVSRSFALLCPALGDVVPDGWFFAALDHLLKNPSANRFYNSAWKTGAPEFTDPQGFFAPGYLIRRERKKEIEFSVIIPTYNRSDILKLCLERLAAQDFPKDQFEVFVCDDGSTDNTAGMVKTFKAPFALEFITQKNAGPATARNKGIRKAGGKYLLILNDDALLEPNAFKLHRETHAANPGKKISVLGLFALLPEYQAKPFGYMAQNSGVLFWYNRMKSGGLYDYNYFYTCNISVPRQAVLEAGLFDEDFNGPAAEDIELGLRLEKAGYKVFYRPEIIAWHHHEITPRSFCKVHQVRGYGAVTLKWKHPALPFYNNIDEKMVEIWRRLDTALQEEAEAAVRALEALEKTWQETADRRYFDEFVVKMLNYANVLQDYYSRKGILSSPLLPKILERQKAARAALPLISVIIPCYNYGRYLRETTESVLNQTYPNFEVIIINDGSTDNTREVAEKLVANYPQHRITLINQENSGQPAISRNNGIRRAAGSYILPLDGDDKLAPDMLDKCMTLLLKNPNLAIAYTDRRDFGGVDQIVRAGDYDFEKLREANQISHCALYKKEVWEKVGGYRTNVKGVEDWDFWVAAGALGYFGQRIPEPLFWYRRHDTGVYQEVLANYEEKFAAVILNNTLVYPEKNIRWAQSRLSSKSPAGEQKNPVLVSVVIPTYNRPQMLGEAVRSVVNQTEKNFEIIVVNDAGQPVEEVLKAFNDQRIKLVTLPENKGLAAARNSGIAVAAGKYIALLDDDDLFLPGHLSAALTVLSDQRPVVYTDAWRVTFNKTGGAYQAVDKRVPYSMDFDRNKLLLGNISPVNCFVFDRLLAIKAGLFDESLSTLEDWEFWIRLSGLTAFHHIPQATVQVNWRTDGTTMTSSRQEAFAKNRETIYKRYQKDLKQIPNVQEILDEFSAIWSQDAVRPAAADQPLVSIIMLTLNALDFTQKAIGTILKYTDQPYEIMIVDNGSTDGTVDYLKTLAGKHSHIRPVFNKENKGFAGGNNQGVAAARGEYVFLLNNDVLVSSGWLKNMLEALNQDERIGMVGPLTNSISGFQRVSEVPYRDESGFHSFAATMQQRYGGRISPRRRLAGFALLMKKAVYEAVGGLDIRFGNGNYEDDDLCLRVRAAGYVLVVHEGTFIHHYGSQTFKANRMDILQSLDEKGSLFREKWPQVDYEELLEMKNPLFEQIEGWNSEGLKLLEDGQTDAAENLFKRSLQEFPISAEALFGLNIIARSRGNRDQAWQHILKLLKAQPGHAAGLNQAGLLAFEEGQTGQARQWFEAALSKAPDFLEAKRNYGQILIETGEYEAGIQIFRQILERQPEDIPSLLSMANINLEADRLTEVRRLARQVLALDLTNDPALRLISYLNSVEARDPFALAKELHPQLLSANQLLTAGKMEEAETGYKDLLQIEPGHPAFLYGLSLVCRLNGERKESARYLAAVLATAPEFVPALQDYGLLQLEEGRLEEALHYFTRVVELNPASETARQYLSDVFLELGRFQEGLDIILRSLSDHPDDVNTLLRVGKIHWEAGKKETACEYFEKVLALDAGNSLAHEFLDLAGQAV